MRTYRYQNLVYIPIYKNAASSYENFFGEILGWEVMSTENINWKVDTVFAHIREPYDRHLRGTAQFLYQYHLTSILEDDRFSRIVSMGYLDHHSYPITVMFKQNSYDIQWLPLDHPHISGDSITCAFLRKHGIDIKPAQIPKLNKGSEEKINLYKRIKIICEQNNYKNNGLFFLLNDDLLLYNQVINGLDAAGNNPYRHQDSLTQ